MLQDGKQDRCMDELLDKLGFHIPTEEAEMNHGGIAMRRMKSENKGEVNTKRSNVGDRWEPEERTSHICELDLCKCSHCTFPLA